MILSDQILAHIGPGKVLKPLNDNMQLPEKVLQFGTGVLLRGLTDYFIDKANRQGMFNGSVVVLKSTSKGGTNEFSAQDNLYTICVRGIEDGKRIEENIISSAISRVLQADRDWLQVLKVGASPALKLIVSNTTEVGIQLLNERIDEDVPVSFPAKLLAVLYERYLRLGNAQEADIVVVATELIPDNGRKLGEIIYQLADFNGLEPGFGSWLGSHVIFCNSLVDRIVPGRPEGAALTQLESELGYTDALLIKTEPYRLWAIEGDRRVSALLGLENVDRGLIVEPDIEIYRELKLRLLNGTHSLACALAFLSGVNTVNRAMTDGPLSAYIAGVMQEEIIPAIPYEIERERAMAFAQTVQDRFANPYIDHFWLSISLQYTMKLRIRVVPVLLNYYKCFGKIPYAMALGFGAYLRFMRIIRKEGQCYYGSAGGEEYLITDEQAARFFEWNSLEDAEYVWTVLGDQELWGTDLTLLDGFAAAVADRYVFISKEGAREMLKELYPEDNLGEKDGHNAAEAEHF